MAVAARVRHFVSIADLSSGELVALLDHGAAMKAGTAGRDAPLRGMALAQIFEKPSLRTRLSFDVAMAELGGHSSYLSPQEVGLGRRESVADVARVASRLVDLVVLRTYAHETIEEFARYASVPVINGLSDLSHPCQGLADIFTIRERKGLDGTITAYVGDGNNVLHSLMLCVAKTGATLRIATPEGYGPQERFLTLARAVEKESGARIELTDDPVAAVTGAVSSPMPRLRRVAVGSRSGTTRNVRCRAPMSSTPMYGRAWVRSRSTNGAGARSRDTR